MEQENLTKVSNEEEVENMEKPSYTYWKRETDTPFSNDFKPQKSDSNVSEDTQNSAGNFGSAWNRAGTWEEKHLTNIQLEEFFNKSLRNKTRLVGDSLSIDKVSSFTGDTYFVFIRGKIKFVYECEFSLQLKGVKDFEGVTGEVKVSEVNNHTLDDDFEFEYKENFKGDADKSRIMESLCKSNHHSSLQKVIREIFDEMKDSCLQTGNI